MKMPSLNNFCEKFKYNLFKIESALMLMCYMFKSKNVTCKNCNVQPCIIRSDIVISFMKSSQKYSLIILTKRKILNSDNSSSFLNFTKLLRNKK